MSHDIKVERADAGARRVIVSANPHSGAYDRRPLIDELVKRLEAKKFEVEQLGEIDQVCKTANRWLEDGTLRAVIAAGGDGTAALLANRLPATVPLVIFPLGTANLLAKYLFWAKMLITNDPLCGIYTRDSIIRSVTPPLAAVLVAVINTVITLLFKSLALLERPLNWFAG